MKVFLLAILALWGGLLAGCATTPHTSSASPESIKGAADKAYTAGQWPEAARLYAQLARKFPQDATILIRLGNALGQEDRWELAAYAYQRALQADPLQGKAAYDLAVARLAQAQEAATWALRNATPGSPFQAQSQRLLQVIAQTRSALISTAGDPHAPDQP